MRIPERLQPLVDDGLVQDVIQPLPSGKEAMLFVVRANDEYCVAKVYKDVQQRSFQHRAGYAEGRRVRNSRQRRAMEKGTRFGKEQAEAAWQNAEVDALFRLSDAGIRVPRPSLFCDGVLLMDLILDADGNPAPRLFDQDLSPDDARELHAFLVRQVVGMLCLGLIHGDLSECNVLLAWDGAVIIDLPQASEAAQNTNAKKLLVRDVENLTRYLSRFAPELATTRYGEEIWHLFERGQLFPDTPLTGVWRGSDRKANTRAVLAEIDAAAREAQRKRAALGEDSGPRPRRGSGGKQAPSRRDTAPTGPRAAPPARGQARSAAPPDKKTPVRAAAELDLDDLDALLVVGPRPR